MDLLQRVDQLLGFRKQQNVAKLGVTWVASFLLAVLLTPGFNSFETPPLESVRSFVESNRLGVDYQPSEIYVRGINNLFYPTHELGSLLFALPFGELAGIIAKFTNFDFKDVFGLLMGYVGAAVFATTIILLTVLADEFEFLPQFQKAKLFLVLLSSQYLVYSLYPVDVSLSAPVLLWTFLMWRKAEGGSEPSWVLTGVGVGILILLKITNLALLPVVVVLCLTVPKPGRRNRILTALGIGLLPGLLLTGIWNFIRTGALGGTTYPEIHNFSIDWFPFGVIGTMLSPGKGLLLYSPVFLLVPLAFTAKGFLWRYKRESFFILGSLGIAIARIGGTAAWTGWGGWGIRYYVPWLPLLSLIVAYEWQRAEKRPNLHAFAWICILLGLTMNLAGVVTNFHYRQSLCGFEPWTLFGTNTCAIMALPGNLARTLGMGLGDIVVSGASSRNIFVSNRITSWWYAIQTMGIPGVISWSIGLGLATAAVITGRNALSS